MYMCVCTCTCHTGALHITCNKHVVLLLSRYSVKDPGQRSRIEEEFVARSKCIQSHYMYVTLPFTSTCMLIAAKPYKSTMDPSPHLYLCWWQPNSTRAPQSRHAINISKPNKNPMQPLGIEPRASCCCRCSDRSPTATQAIQFQHRVRQPHTQTNA